MLIPVALMLFGAAVDAATHTTGIDPFRANYDFAAGLAGAVPDVRLRGFVIATKFLGNANIAVFVAVMPAHVRPARLDAP